MSSNPTCPTDESARAIRTFTASARPVDLAFWLDRLETEKAGAEFAKLDRARQAEVFGCLPLDLQAELARRVPHQDLVRIVAGLNADDRVDLFNRLTPEAQVRLAQDLEPKAQADIRRLAGYAEESAGAIMTSDYAVLDADMTARAALDALRQQATGSETIYRSYVVDADHRLIGSVRLHALVLAAEETPLTEIMETEPVSVTSDTDQEIVGQMVARYDLLAIPVVDGGGRLVGIVTHDDATDVMEAEATEDFQKMSHVLPFKQTMRRAAIGTLYSRRIVWLALLVFGNLFSGAGIAYFEDMILAYVSLVFFLPLLIDSSGNAGAQSATLMVRALATGDVEMKDWRDLILREVAVAAALGATMAAVVFPLGAWRGGVDVAITVGLTMFVVVLIGSLVGMSLPFLLSRLRLDPATASGPLVTTISDAMGVLIYFSIATLVLSL
ncbi:magnesium transporter [Thalassorhabdomicrobium marinisediminis]|uniref:Magnesium transporter MgtE n=1 Tax=Thalassorhabdomicrobium marinisediminis TaxID=2170577 RepID=A0A2T7FZL2_9RHOB|nr:magnesium transporter [Thalassorhabdomicrobium marinisediminis]PVA07600.1 magnesium transporter [Thalassorhabdomicrobium marinisediminis]